MRQIDRIREVSVCIPYYKGARTIFMCVASVYAQTIKSQGSAVQSGQVEIIVTSDDDSDEARRVLSQVKETFGAQVFFNERKLGLTGNWQAALSKGSGKIVTLLHQDDWYLPGCLEAVVDRFTSDDRVVLVAFNALLDGRADRVQLKTESFHRKGREIAFQPETMDIVFAPSVTFIRGDVARAQPVLYNEAYKWSPERELYYNIANNRPGMLLAFDSRPLVCRGLSDGQFSVTNEDLRVLDALTFWERLSRSDPDKAAALGKMTLEQVLDRMRRWIKAARTPRPSAIADGWRWLSRIYSDPRFLELIGAHPDTFEAFVAGIAKGGAEMGALTFDCLKLHLPKGPEKDAAVSVLEGAMQPDTAKLERAKARLPRIVDDEQFNAPVIICGFHHSGTRLLAQVLEAIGVFQHAPTPTREWSYMQHLNTVLLPGWTDPDAIAAFDGSTGPEVISPEILALRLSADGYVGGQPWGHKDPRNSVAAEAWLKVFPNARLVNIVRDPLDVLGTLAHDYAPFSPKGLLPQREPEFWARLWCSYLDTTRRAMALANHAVEVRFEDLCEAPVEVTRTIIKALDLDCSVEPNDLADLNILPSKRGAYKEWIEQGTLAPAEVDALRRGTAAAGLQWARGEFLHQGAA